MLPSVDTLRAARAFRAVRLHLGLRQRDVAARAGVGQQTVSDLERGRLGAMTFSDAACLFDALDIRTFLTVSWRGGELDRLLDEGHAAIGGACAARLLGWGWVVLSEVTFSVYGERGSIDLLAWHAATRTLLVIEIKTEVTSAEETLRRHDVKVRLAPGLCRERFGATPANVVRLLVLADSSANRARVGRLAPLFDAAYPLRGHALRRWLANPSPVAGGLMFLNTGSTGANGLPPRRVRTRKVRNTGATGGTARIGG